MTHDGQSVTCLQPKYYNRELEM